MPPITNLIVSGATQALSAPAGTFTEVGATTTIVATNGNAYHELRHDLPYNINYQEGGSHKLMGGMLFTGSVGTTYTFVYTRPD